MNHESFRELIALHLYGEVEGEERARLERHLEECGACRSYAREMVEGLGRIAADAGHVSGELPLDWSERLHAAVLEEPRVARMHPSWPWWTAAAGFAAGVVAAGMIGRGKPVSPAIERTRPRGRGSTPRLPRRWRRPRASWRESDSTCGGKYGARAISQRFPAARGRRKSLRDCSGTVLTAAPAIRAADPPAPGR